MIKILEQQKKLKEGDEKVAMGEVISQAAESLQSGGGRNSSVTLKILEQLKKN